MRIPSSFHFVPRVVDLLHSGEHGTAVLSASFSPFSPSRRLLQVCWCDTSYFLEFFSSSLFPSVVSAAFSALQEICIVVSPHSFGNCKRQMAASKARRDETSPVSQEAVERGTRRSCGLVRLDLCATAWRNASTVRLDEQGKMHPKMHLNISHCTLCVLCVP